MNKSKKLPKINGKKLDHKMIALGEATGHHHSATADSASLWELDGGLMVLDAPDGTDVTHQEHNTISLPPGQYDRHIVVEYDHFAEESREVRD